MWIDIQIHRMRVSDIPLYIVDFQKKIYTLILLEFNSLHFTLKLIWMLAEKMSRTLVKADNVLQRQNEVTTSSAITCFICCLKCAKV